MTLRCFICILLAVSAANLRAATVHYVQTSENDADGSTIGAVASDQWLTTGSTYSTANAPAAFSGYRFSHWSNGSYPIEPYRDAWGRSLNPISFTLYEDTTATAHYLPTTWDSDGDGVPDWFEIEYYGTLANGAGSDTDGDGITLRDEQAAGTNPLYANSTLDGGATYADSAMVTVNFGGYPRYTITSIPAGIVDQETVVPNGTSVTTPNMTQSEFGYWELDGVRQEDEWGSALRQISFTVNGADRNAVARFFLDDGDADGINDAYEQYYYGTLANDASSDTDGDGVTLRDEYSAGTNPLFGESHQDGGVAWVDSGIATVNFGGYPRYTIASVPAGIVDQTVVVRDVTSVTTPNMTQPEFGYWELDGVRQEDAWGSALRQITFTVNGADRDAVAHFFLDDSDADGINDAYEQYYYGTLASDASSDTDGDGVTLKDEYTAGTNPLFGESHQDGGVAWIDSGIVVANLQPYDRLSKALVGGDLTDFFSPDPSVVTGADFGTWSSAALTDWDGDGDLDLFVASEEGLRVFRNIGSARNPNFEEVTSGFEGLSAFVTAINRPVIAGGDWNGDGFGDLVIGGNTGTLRLIASNGAFSANGAGTDFEVASSRARPALGDINKDGKLDLLVLLDDGTVQLYLNSGLAMPFGGTGTANVLGVSAPAGTSISVGDINGDGVADVLLSDSDGRIWDFRNTGNGAFSLLSKVWGGSFGGFASGLTLAVGDLEGDGDLDVIGGLSNGGLIALRDPHAGRPTGLIATPGANAIQLRWDPNTQSRIRGYYIYRSLSAEGPWATLLPESMPLPSYLDTSVSPSVENFYRVSSVSYFYVPGNSQPRIVESLASDVASSSAGKVVLSVRPARGNPGQKVKINISIENSIDVAGSGMKIRVAYDSAKLQPLAQARPGQQTVLATGLSRNLTFSDNGATATGEIVIDGISGALEPGAGKLFTLQFEVGAGVPHASVFGVSIAEATLLDINGNALAVGILSLDQPESGDTYTEGDLDGDGSVTTNDKELLKQLIKPKSRAPTQEELMAGDLNGDGALDEKDLVLLMRLLGGLPINE